MFHKALEPLLPRTGLLWPGRGHDAEKQGENNAGQFHVKLSFLLAHSASRFDILACNYGLF